MSTHETRERTAVISGCAMITMACILFLVLVGYGVWALVGALL